ncbi:MAG TPA: fluoride efflux transporter CrcB [Rhizomicrobium sp.]
MPFQLYAVVALGGALGTAARYFVSGAVANAFSETFPWGTLIINVVGSFVIGFFWTLTVPDWRLFVSGSTRQFVITGFCGGFTTFSSFSLQTMNLMRDGEWLYAGGNILGSVTLCMLGVWLGSLTAALFNQLKGV